MMSLYDGSQDAAKEEKQAKKIMRVGIRAAFSGGIGLAIYLMQKVFGGMAPDENMNILIDNVCLMLMAYAAAIFVIYIFRRKILLKCNLLLVYVVMPCIALKLLMTYL